MKKTIFFGALLLMGSTQAQNGGTFRCGSDNYYHQHLQAHPEVVQERNELENFTTKFIDKYNPLTKSASITIPVVFHVNDPTNPQKVTPAQIQSALDILNEDFTATNSDIANIRPEFSGIIANMDINFCLATKDPQGNATTGITYHTNNYNGREPDGYGSAVKGVEYWPGDQYLNIWVVNETEDDGSLYNSGWAFLPDSWVASNNLDGIVYNHRYLGYVGSSDVDGPTSWQAEMARVLTHEVGHYLNLHHTFENYCSSPGDNVSDTPPVYYHGSNNCDQLGTMCSGVNMVNDQNYMDYTPCPSMFTEGQKTRVLAALNSNVAGRNNLWSTSNLIAVGCTPSVSVDELEKPTVQVYPNPAQSEIQLQFDRPLGNNTSISILDGTGKLISTQSINLTNITLFNMSIEHLETGLYFIQVANKDFTQTIRVVKNT